MAGMDNSLHIKQLSDFGATFAAVTVATFLPGLIMTALSGSLIISSFVCFVSLLHTLMLGLPFYWICKGNGWIHWWSSLICGFFIGSLPLSLLFLTNNVGTPDFLNFMSLVFLPLGLLGAITGFSAWCTWTLILRATRS